MSRCVFVLQSTLSTARISLAFGAALVLLLIPLPSPLPPLAGAEGTGSCPTSTRSLMLQCIIVSHLDPPWSMSDHITISSSRGYLTLNQVPRCVCEVYRRSEVYTPLYTPTHPYTPLYTPTHHYTVGALIRRQGRVVHWK